MRIVVVALWLGLAALYLWRKKTAAVIYLLSLAIFPFYWIPVEFPPLPDLSVHRIVALGLTMGIALEMAADFQNHEVEKRTLLLVLGVLAIVLIWSVSALDVGLSNAARRGLGNVLDFWLPYSLAVHVALTREQTRSLLKWLAWPALGVAVLTVYEYVTQTPVAWQWFAGLSRNTFLSDWWSPTGRAGILRVQATFGQPIFLGFYLTATGLLLLLLGIAQRGPRRLWTYAAAIGVLAASILPMARGSILALVAGLLITTTFLGGRMRWAILLAGAVCLGLLWLNIDRLEGVGSFWSDFLLTLAGRATAGVEADQLKNWSGRLDVLDAGLQTILRGPLFGYGDTTASGTSQLLDLVIVFIQVGFISGLIGMLALLGFLIFTTMQALRNWYRELRAGSDSLLAVSMLVMLTVVILSWVGSSWPGQFTQIGWLFLGMVMAWRPASHPQPARPVWNAS